MVRREKNLTQAKLGKLVGNSRAAVQKIENGKSLQPRNTIDLAEALDVNPAWLQFGEPFAVRKRP
jgi:DNA-binding XRE family transcriptional regulator